MDDGLDERLDAIERALTDGETADGLPEVGRLDARLDDLETTVADLDDRLADLEAAVQALRGFAGGVSAVDEAVERQANAAVARVERLETDLRAVERAVADGRPADATDGVESADRVAPDDGPDDDLVRSDSAGASNGRHDADAASKDHRRSRPGARSSPHTRSADATGTTDASLAETAAAAARREVDRETSGEYAADAGDASLADRLRRLL
jgi:hypothetical protein